MLITSLVSLCKESHEGGVSVSSALTENPSVQFVLTKSRLLF